MHSKRRFEDAVGPALGYDVLNRAGLISERPRQLGIQWACDEIGGDADTRLFLDAGVMIEKALSRRGGPAREVGIGEPWAPSAPIQGLAAEAVGKAREVDVATPTDTPHQLARHTRIVRGIDRRGHIEADIREILDVL